MSKSKERNTVHVGLTLKEAKDLIWKLALSIAEVEKDDQASCIRLEVPDKLDPDVKLVIHPED